MSAATPTTQGEVVLSGDLAGGNDGNFPQLRASGVTPGTYANALAFTVDAKGRVLSISQPAAANVTAVVNTATTDIRGIVQIGDGFSITGDAIIGVRPATADLLGFSTWGAPFAIDGTGNVTYDLPLATETVKGGVIIPEGGAVYSANGVLSIRTATAVDPGVARIDTASGGLAISSGVLSTVAASTTAFGMARAGTNMTLDVDGTLNVNFITATTAVKGIVQIGTNSGLEIANGVLNFVGAPAATTVTKGSVQVGAGLAINAGVLSMPDASATTKGIVQIQTSSGQGGVLSVSSGVLGWYGTNGASTTSLGLVAVGSGFAVDANGVVSLAQAAINASTTTKGVLQTGAGVKSVAGVLQLPYATTSSLGGVKLGAAGTGFGLELINGVVNIVRASTSTLGFIQIGNGFVYDGETLNISTIPLNQANSQTFANNTRFADINSGVSTQDFDMTKACASWVSTTGSLTANLVYDGYDAASFNYSTNFIEFGVGGTSQVQFAAYFTAFPDGDTRNPKIKLASGITFTTVVVNNRTYYRFAGPGPGKHHIFKIESIQMAPNDRYALISVDTYTY